jgi:phage terminase large subunit-like protein
LMNSSNWSAWAPRRRRTLEAHRAAKTLQTLSDPIQSKVAHHPFRLTARATQVLPPDLRRTWLLSGGSGAGKTRAGAELVRWAVLQAGYRRVAPSFNDVREVMI